MTTYTIVKKATGEEISFDTELTEDQACELLLAQKTLSDFGSSLVSNYVANRASRNQVLWMLKLAADLTTRKPEQPGSLKPLVDAVARMQEGRKARVILRLQGLQIKACTMGANAGGVYLNRGSVYLGKVTANGRLYLAGALGEQGTIALEQQLADAAADPQAAAIEYGKASGSCACCGRDLSDPVSIWGGIGPICLERMAGADARKQLEAAFKASQLGAVF